MRQCIIKSYKDPYFPCLIDAITSMPIATRFTRPNTSAPLNATPRPRYGGDNDRMRVAARLGSGVTKMLIFADLLAPQ